MLSGSRRAPPSSGYPVLRRQLRQQSSAPSSAQDSQSRPPRTVQDARPSLSGSTGPGAGLSPLAPRPDTRRPAPGHASPRRPPSARGGPADWGGPCPGPEPSAPPALTHQDGHDEAQRLLRRAQGLRHPGQAPAGPRHRHLLRRPRRPVAPGTQQRHQHRGPRTGLVPLRAHWLLCAGHAHSAPPIGLPLAEGRGSALSKAKVTPRVGGAARCPR